MRTLNNLWKFIRTRYYLTFKMNYVLKSVSKRRGRCKRCSCCPLTILNFKYKCKNYNPIDKSCLVYNTDKMPKSCFYYPFDEKNKWDEFKDKCGFWWEERNSGDKC